jgi:uncharacterized protein (TIGR03435 family)
VPARGFPVFHNVILAIGVALCSIAVRAQEAAPAPLPTFEVASVKENMSGSQRVVFPGQLPGRYTATNVPLIFIVQNAFQLRAHEIAGAPDWTFSTPFDITATYPPGIQPTGLEARLMVQKLLADRFGLVTHRETRELPMYALTVARGDGRLGPNLVRSDVDCEKWIAEKRPQRDAGGPSPVAPSGFRPACMLNASVRYLTGGTRTIQQLTAALQSLVERPVVDRTGLSGTFDMDMKWTSGVASAPGSNAAPVDDGASIFTALQEQLGLKLEAGRAPFEVLVIDSVSRPTPD